MNGAKAISRILSGSLIGQGVLILISPILTRLYTPEDFGALAIVTAIASSLGALVTLAWDSAILLAVDDAEARALTWLATLTAIGVSVMLAVAGFLAREPLADAFSARILADLWWLVPATVFVIGMYKVGSAWLARQRAFGAIGIRNIVQGLAQAAFNLILGFAGLAPLGLVAGLGFGRGVAALSMLGPGSGFTGPLPARAQLRAAARRYRRFPLVTSWSYAVNTVGLQLPVLLLSVAYGAYEIGILALTMRVLASPVAVLTDAIRNYYEGTFGALLREGGNVRRFFLRTTRNLSLLAAFGVLVILIAAPWAFSAVFGPEWELAGRYAQILAVTYGLQLVVSPVSATITLLQRQFVQLAWDIGRAVLIAGGILLAVALDQSFIIAIVAMAVIQAIAYLVLFAMSARATPKS